MKFILLILIVFFYSCNIKFKNYRYNPFQFVYDEYYFTAKKYKIKKKSTSELRDLKFFTVYNFKFALDSNIADTCISIKNVTYFKKNDKKLFIISKRKDLKMGCNDSLTQILNRDYCNSFQSEKDFYFKLFFLTPNDLEKNEYAEKGNFWIVHYKGWFFEDTRPPLIAYENDSYIAYRRNFIKPTPLACEVILFHKELEGNYLTFGFSQYCDEKTINQILSSITLIKKNQEMLENLNG